jgi:hypothetical protein
MGIDLGDYDGDGDFDLYITDLDEAVGYSSPLYRNLLVETGEFRFEQIAFELGTRPLTGGGGGTMWGVLFADFNLDTHLDLMVTGARARYMFVGRGDGDFVTAAGPDSEVHSDGTGLPLFVTSTIGSAMADFDRDGDPDVLLVRCDMMQQATPLLLRNDTPRGLKHFLEIDLVGTQSNRSAIGTVVEVRPEGAQGPVLLRQVVAGHSAHSQSERVLHFGLGHHERVDRIDIRWPSGLDQVLRDVAVDRMLVVTEGEGVSSWSPANGWVPSEAPAQQ